MINIGCVLYKKGDEPGTLEATFHHSIIGKGTGLATGGPAEGFAGLYRIRYFDGNGEETAGRELDIRKGDGCYHLTWIHNGEITGRGIGMEVAEGLAAGWSDMD